MITLKRIAHTDKGTFGVLLDGETPFALTAECPWAENKRGVSCIPRGWYTCKRVRSPRFGETFEVTKVPGRTHILFHKGNTPADTRGCIAELKTQVSYLKTVETYAGQLGQDIETTPVRFPAAYVSYGGSGFSAGDLGSSGHAESVTFSVLVCARDLGGQEKARKDAQGAYDIVKDVLAALSNNDLGLDIEPVKPVRASLLFSDRETAVYDVSFSTEFQRA